MESAPTLTQSQIGKALSATKRKPKKKLKNVRNILSIISTPACVKLTDEECSEFEEMFSAIFQYNPPYLPKWAEIKSVTRKMTKAERVKYRKSLFKPPVRHPSYFNLILGLNAVTRSLESKTATLVLISDDIKPVLMHRHIIQSCVTSKIPFCVLPQLNRIIKKCIGFPSITLAFKHIEKTDPLFPITTYILSKEIQPNNDLDTSLNETIEAQPDKQEAVAETVENEATIVYLHRDSVTERSFVPQKIVEKKIQEKMDYIELGNDDDDDDDDEKSGGNVYKNLKIKRLKPNENRQKGKKK